MRLTPQQLRFLLSGLFNTLVGLALIYGGMLLGLNDVTANFLGYSIGITSSFVLNRNWTFRHNGAMGSTIGKYAVAVSCAYLANLTTMLISRDYAGVSPWLAQAIGVGPYAGVLYYLCAYYVFKRSRT